MPIPPVPKHYKCTRCSWGKRVSPQSDCLLPYVHFNSCPKCGSSVTAEADTLTVAIKRVGRFLGIK